MRVSAVGMGFDSEEAVLREAAATAAVTHDHPEGVKGAQATALSVFLARRGASKEEIRGAVEARFGYDLGRRLDDIRPDYRFHVSCMESVPESIIAFLESACYEDAVRKAVSLGGDADTMGCIAGGIAEAYYGGVPKDIEDNVRRRLPQEFLELLDEMYAKFGNCETLREGGGDNGGEVAENAGVKKDGGCDKVGDVDDAGGVEKKGSAEDVGAN
ncbi:unnamed protein product [Ostreobium quekettii]|uniref:ADP-ribosylglycohydrolase n=1 Tax=Ostreobium quekettii TaxID=121088 RepID=A0A8S1J6A4_9CHLO|nr:unnamed protein product [Ostreobium quekettii]